MSREVFEELKQDEAFVEKVANRIYIESDDFEDSMSETEWICEMTDIADKYIQRFKLAFKLANKVSKQPTLNENQQIVLEWLKKQYFQGYGPAIIRTIHLLQRENTIDVSGSEPVIEAYRPLDTAEEAVVVKMFADWALGQEEWM